MEDVNVLPTASFPAPFITGNSGDSAPGSPATLPTVLDLSRSGERFVLADIAPSTGGYGEVEFVDPAGDPTPDSTQLFFRQFVVHVPDGVYSTFQADGIPYISNSVEFGFGSRVCFTTRYGPLPVTAPAAWLVSRVLRRASRCSCSWLPICRPLLPLIHATVLS